MMSANSPEYSEFRSLLWNVLGEAAHPIALHQPTFTTDDVRSVGECVESGWVSSVGSFVNEFEEALANFTSSRHAIAVVNGTTALEMALRLVGVKPGDEVIVPSASFVATANAVAHCGAVPHFVDVDFDRMTLSPELLQAHLKSICVSAEGHTLNRLTGARITALVPMHTFGIPADLMRILPIANEFGLVVVEDAAESLGSFIGSQHTGTVGRVGVLSFNGNKIVTTGGGGAILTNTDEIAARARLLTTTAKVPHPWEFDHSEVGWNYRMPNLNAALGCAQMRALPQIIKRKRRLADAYFKSATECTHMTVIREPSGTTSNYWLNAIRLNSPSISRRNELISAAISAGYMCRPLWKPLHSLPMYESCPRGSLVNTITLYASVINVPSSPVLIPN
jgi:perosamine synthetase